MDLLVAAALPSLPVWSAYAAVMIAGVAGASYAARRQFDVIGVLGLAVASGLGGLLLRDVLLQKGTPVVLTDPRYLLTAAMAALLGFLFASAIARVGVVLLVLDALGMGLFVSLGAVAALYYDLGIPAAVFLGVTTAIGGSILRDLLSGEPPAVFRPGIFSGIAALFGAIVFVALDEWGVPIFYNQVATIVAVAGLRWLALWRKWESPSSGDFLGKLEDLLHRAREPLPTLSKAPAAAPNPNADAGADPAAGVDPVAGADPAAGVDPVAGADPAAGVDPVAGSTTVADGERAPQ